MYKDIAFGSQEIGYFYWLKKNTPISSFSEHPPTLELFCGCRYGNHIFYLKGLIYMSTLNRTRPRSRQAIATHEGGRGRTAPAELELALRGMTTVFHDKFYETAQEQLDEIFTLVKRSRPSFVEQLAIVLRQEFNMRSSPAALLAMYTLEHGQPSDRVISRVFFRGDEIGDYLGTVHALSNNGKVIPSAARFTRKVLQQTINERKALRYARIGREWSLAKAILLSHARAGADASQTALFNFVIRWSEHGSQTQAWNILSEGDRAQLPMVRRAVLNEDDGAEISWERRRSQGESWSTLIDNMGYMALLRNLRNFLEEIPTTETSLWDRIVNRIYDRDEVRKSRQFPFRFFSAYQALSYPVPNNKWTSLLKAALSDALDISVENLPEFPGRTLIIADGSGSMGMNISDRSDVTCRDIANVFSASLYLAQGNADIVHFASRAKRTTTIHPNDGVFGAMEKFPTSGEVGYATNLQAALREADDVRNYDQIFIFSDMQIHDDVSIEFRKYKGTVYSVNLAAYTPQLGINGNVVEVGGWSDSTLSILGHLSRNNLVQWIENYE